MKTSFALMAVFAFGLSGCGRPPNQTETAKVEELAPGERDHSEIVNVDGSDVEMNAAIQKAKDTLGSFVERFNNPKPGDSEFALKLMIKDDYGVEHFWITDLVKQDKGWTGVVANDPKTVKSVKAGQTVVFETDRITDWSFEHDGVRQGSFTLRVLLTRMPREQADYYREIVGWSE